MKQLIILAMFCSLGACANMPAVSATQVSGSVCKGNTSLPPAVSGQFKPITDKSLLNSVLGKPEEGGLCRGQVYQSKPASKVIVYRAWNSTNPASEKGQWWSFRIPRGQISHYRSNYEICYQWSPIDSLVRCRLKPGSRIVVGPGQSAKCSKYLSYPVSATQQVYIRNARQAATHCSVYRGIFRWQK